MQELCKRILPFAILFVFLSSFSYAIEECTGVISTDKIPCLIYYPVINTSTPCNTINVSFYNETVNIYNHTMTQHNYFTCNATFNLTELSSYTFYYSNEDTGAITVVEGERMIYLLYFAMALIIALFIIGFVKEDFTFIGLSGILLMVFGVYVHINGFNQLSNIITSAISLITILIGFYVLIAAAFEYAELANM